MSKHNLAPCPRCGSGDIRFCNISVRPYCGDCNHWAHVNHGTAEDAVKQWNDRAARVAKQDHTLRTAPEVLSGFRGLVMVCKHVEALGDFPELRGAIGASEQIINNAENTP